MVRLVIFNQLLLLCFLERVEMSLQLRRREKKDNCLVKEDGLSAEESVG
jgi:hypothetical protein